MDHYVKAYPIFSRIRGYRGLQDMPVLIIHLKPIFYDEMMEEVSPPGRETITPLVQGSEIVL